MVVERETSFVDMEEGYDELLGKILESHPGGVNKCQDRL